MQKYMIIFTTICCVILAGINLWLNFRLYQFTGIKNAAEETEMLTASADIADGEGLGLQAGYIEDSVTVLSAAANTEPKYKLGTRGGYITIFYGAGGGAVVKEITGLPSGALPADEQIRLAQGIPVYDDEELAKLLQDYGS